MSCGAILLAIAIGDLTGTRRRPPRHGSMQLGVPPHRRLTASAESREPAQDYGEGDPPQQLRAWRSIGEIDIDRPTAARPPNERR